MKLGLSVIIPFGIKFQNTNIPAIAGTDAGTANVPPVDFSPILN